MINSKKENIDHREISKELDLYFFYKKEQGMPFLLSDWVIIRNNIQNLIRKEWEKSKFNEVISPVLGEEELYITSGHLEHYQDYMFPLIENKKKNEIYYLRPMTCPHHCLIYKRKIVSYHDLPIKICENSLLHRYESSGSLRGLERTRYMELVDHHIFIDFDRLKEEIKEAYFFSNNLLKKFNFIIDRVVLSLHDIKKEKYHSNQDIWCKSEDILKIILSELNIPYIIEIDNAAFYGPKIDLEVLSLDNKYTTISTIQIDFYLPIKFNLFFIDKNGKKQSPIIIHQSPIGTYQRFISFLLERNSGYLPFIIAPVHLAILPLSNLNLEIMNFCNKINNYFLDKKIKTVIISKKNLNYRIREVYKKKIPFFISVGKNEIESNKFKLKKCFSNIFLDNLTITDIINFLLKEIYN